MAARHRDPRQPPAEWVGVWHLLEVAAVAVAGTSTRRATRVVQRFDPFDVDLLHNIDVMRRAVLSAAGRARRPPAVCARRLRPPPLPFVPIGAAGAHRGCRSCPSALLVLTGAAVRAHRRCWCSPGLPFVPIGAVGAHRGCRSCPVSTRSGHRPPQGRNLPPRRPRMVTQEVEEFLVTVLAHPEPSP